MKRSTHAATTILLLVASSLATGQTPTMTTLHDLQDRARPLLIFAPTPDDPRLQIQLRTLDEHAAEASEREILPIALPYKAPGPTATHLLPTEAESVRRRFHISPTEFVVILLGEDGGAKLRATEPFTIGKLKQTIDAMPMRQEQMRHPTR